MHFMQTIFPIVFIAVVAWVALIWAIVIIVTIRNVVAAKNRGENDGDKTVDPTSTPTPTDTTALTTPTIAGMPIGTYYATQMTDWTIH